MRVLGRIGTHGLAIIVLCSLGIWVSVSLSTRLNADAIIAGALGGLITHAMIWAWSERWLN